MIRWGIIGYGNIAKRFVKSLAHSKKGRLYAIASKSAANIDDVIMYRHYDDLINDENVDAIYIALRHQDHFEYAKKALLNHKAVLCEKPATLSLKQTKELCDISKDNKVFFMEAMKTRFIPLISDIKKLVNDGTLGHIHKITTSFCNDVPYQKDSYLFDLKQGGALYDVGVYNIAFMLDFFKELPISFDISTSKREGVDGFIEVCCHYQDTDFIMRAGIDRNEEKILLIEGDLKSLKAIPFYRPVDAKIYDELSSEVISKDYLYDDFYGEIEEVHDCILNHLYESQRMSHDDSIKIIEFVEKIREDARWLRL